MSESNHVSGVSFRKLILIIFEKARAFNMSKLSLTFVVLGIMISSPLSSYAQHEQEGRAESHETYYHRNHVSLFLGATSELKDDKDVHGTAGLDYVRWFGATGTWGAGGFAEVIFKDHLEGLLGAHVYFYPANKFWIMAGSGIEFHLEDTHQAASKSESESSTDREISFLFRTGLGYNFELGGFSVAPAVFLDTVRDTASLVWGINVGKGF